MFIAQVFYIAVLLITRVRFLTKMSAYTTTESVDLVLGVTSDFSLGETLVSVHYVLGMVFKYLRYKDLESASKVNVKWKEVAVKEMEGRNVVNHFSCKRGEDWIRFINQGYYKSKVHVVFLNQIHILIIRGKYFCYALYI